MEEENKLKNIFSIEKRTKYFAKVLAGLCFFSLAIFFLLIIGNNRVQAEKEKGDPAEAPAAFNDISLEGKGVVVWDVVNSRELFSKNADEPLPLASLTKVLTAIVASEKMDGSKKVEIENEFLAPEGDSQLVAGDVWRAKDLTDYTLLTSSNDGAMALAAVAENSADTSSEKEKLFIKEMNDAAERIGLSNSRFFNEHGLDLAEKSGGAYGSARDMATLFEYALKNRPQVLEVTRYKNLEFSSAEKIYNAENTNDFVDQIPGLIASKTGYTDLAGGNLVVAFDAGLNRPIIISVLGSTEEGRFEDVLKLAGASIKFINAGQ